MNIEQACVNAVQAGNDEQMKGRKTNDERRKKELMGHPVGIQALRPELTARRRRRQTGCGNGE
jgi:hypothetical protein